MEIAFDLASPGAYFQRPLTVDDAGRLAWAGIGPYSRANNQETTKATDCTATRPATNRNSEIFDSVTTDFMVALCCHSDRYLPFVGVDQRHGPQHAA